MIDYYNDTDDYYDKSGQRMRRMDIDVMVNHGDKFYGRLKFSLPVTPYWDQFGHGFKVNPADIGRKIAERFPSLVGRTDIVIYSNIVRSGKNYEENRQALFQ